MVAPDANALGTRLSNPSDDPSNAAAQPHASALVRTINDEVRDLGEVGVGLLNGRRHALGIPPPQLAA